MPETKDELIQWIAGTVWEVETREKGKNDQTAYLRFLDFGVMQTSINKVQWYRGGGYTVVNKNTFVYGYKKYTVSFDDSFRTFNGSSAGGLKTVTGRLEESR